MNKQEFLSAIEEMLEVEEGSLKGDEPLTDLPWDSLAVVSFIALADEHLDVAVSPQGLVQAKTLSDVLALVANKLD
jgi:acyl carrier protein